MCEKRESILKLMHFYRMAEESFQPAPLGNELEELESTLLWGEDQDNVQNINWWESDQSINTPTNIEAQIPRLEQWNQEMSNVFPSVSPVVPLAIPEPTLFPLSPDIEQNYNVATNLFCSHNQVNLSHTITSGAVIEPSIECTVNPQHSVPSCSNQAWLLGESTNYTFDTSSGIQVHNAEITDQTQHITSPSLTPFTFESLPLDNSMLPVATNYDITTNLPPPALLPVPSSDSYSGVTDTILPICTNSQMSTHLNSPLAITSVTPNIFLENTENMRVITPDGIALNSPAPIDTEIITRNTDTILPSCTISQMSTHLNSPLAITSIAPNIFLENTENMRIITPEGITLNSPAPIDTGITTRNTGTTLSQSGINEMTQNNCSSVSESAVIPTNQTMPLLSFNTNEVAQTVTSSTSQTPSHLVITIPKTLLIQKSTQKQQQVVQPPTQVEVRDYPPSKRPRHEETLKNKISREYSKPRVKKLRKGFQPLLQKIHHPTKKMPRPTNQKEVLDEMLADEGRAKSQTISHLDTCLWAKDPKKNWCCYICCGKKKHPKGYVRHHIHLIGPTEKLKPSRCPRCQNVTCQITSIRRCTLCGPIYQTHEKELEEEQKVLYAEELPQELDAEQPAEPNTDTETEDDEIEEDLDIEGEHQQVGKASTS
ncbi:hypothetical protein QAD02_001215 [Eretmocerus hayati]|uniref:Uncharacterized protein n=1 Tax=Eretmocerus hayati TaxID=131215 RepID=A0ACC2NH54_9HYME|nr:hypothetical protein QAD02_001215 [Eretmocerus hayati]